MTVQPKFKSKHFFSSSLIKKWKKKVCDYCDTSIPEKDHPPQYAIDGTENWWQSPPLSRGMKYNEVNLTIDFGQVSLFLNFNYLF